MIKGGLLLAAIRKSISRDLFNQRGDDRSDSPGNLSIVSVKDILISSVDTLFQVSRQSFYNIELDYIRMHELSVVYGSFLLFLLLNVYSFLSLCLISILEN